MVIFPILGLLSPAPAMQFSEIADACDPQDLRKAIAEGINDLENGRWWFWNAEEIKAERRRLLPARKAT